MTKSAQVLIVGAGPSGLALAYELARRDICIRIIDRAAGPAPTSRALGIHARTLEIFEDMGCVEKILDQGLRINGANIYSEGRRIVQLTFDEIASPFPFVISLPQSNTETILSEGLASFGVEIERGVALEALRIVQRERAHATLKHADGTLEEVEVPWLVGCDGAHSTVRHALGLPFAGSTYSEQFGLADLNVQWSLPHNEMVTFMGTEGIVALIPLPEPGRYRLVADLGATPHEHPEPTLEHFQKLVNERSHMRMKLSNPTWLANFRIHRRMVSSYRVGPIFLAGDAAHIHSPVGGQGMNTGIQDSYNLGWKLALVIQKGAYLSLLNSYTIERKPIAEQTLEATDRATKVIGLRSSVTQQLRNSLASALSNFEIVQQKIAQNLGMLTLNYRESPSVEQHRDSIAVPSFMNRTSSEAPTWRDKVDFGTAPNPGDRAPDVVIGKNPDGSERRLFELMRGTHHTLLLFDGQAQTDGGYRNMERIGRLVASRFGHHTTTHMIVPTSSPPSGLRWDGSIVLDADSTLHRRFGANSDCLYLIRPDGYIGYRSQPSDMKQLFRYLDRIFI